MKTLKICLLFIILISAFSCGESGETDQYKIDNSLLPPELQGLKVYKVDLGINGYTLVGILNDKINSMSYPVGKYSESIILINGKTIKQIRISQILLENDSIVVCRK